MTTRRILLVNLPRLVSELLRELLTPHRDLQVVDAPAGGAERVADTVGRTRPDVVVIGAGQPDSTDPPIFAQLVARLITAGSGIHLVVLGEDGRNAYSCRSLGEISADRLLATIRADEP